MFYTLIQNDCQPEQDEIENSYNISVHPKIFSGRHRFLTLDPLFINACSFDSISAIYCFFNFMHN